MVCCPRQALGTEENKRLGAWLVAQAAPKAEETLGWWLCLALLS